MRSFSTDSRGDTSSARGIVPSFNLAKAKSLQALHADVLVADDTFRIVGLEGKGAFAEFARVFCSGLGAGRFVVFQHCLAIDLDGDFFPFDDDVLRPPLVVLRRSERDIRQAVETTGLDPIR